VGQAGRCGPDAERIGRKYSDSEPFSAYCFRTVADPFAGRINVFKIISGHLQTDANAFNSTRGRWNASARCM
jgi:elongation factor G